MTHQHQLLFLASNLPATSSALCCFAALVRRARNNTLPMTGMELASFEADSITDEAPPSVVHVYQPQSSLQPDGSRQVRKMRRGNSDQLAEKTTEDAWSDNKCELRRTHTLDRWDPSATAPCDHQQHLHRRQQRRSQRPLSLQLLDDMASLPSLIEALLKRCAVPETTLAVETPASALRNDRKPLRRQLHVLNDFGEEPVLVSNCSTDGFSWNAADGGDVSDRSETGKQTQLLSVLEQCGSDNCPDQPAKPTGATNIPMIIVTDCNGQCKLADSVTSLTCQAKSGSAVNETRASKGHTETENYHADVMIDLIKRESLREVDPSSAKVDAYANSILQSVSHIEDAVVSPDDDHMDGGGKIDLNFDIDELLLRLEVPIGESTARDAAAVAALEASEAELARAEAPQLVAVVHPETQQPRRLSDTGSELANSEFRFLRAPPPVLIKLEQPRVTAIVPPLTTVGKFKPSDKRTEFRKRLHRWRQSYAMDGKTLRTVADWGDNQPAVLVSARPPTHPGSTCSSPPPHPSCVQFRAVIFHPASLTVSTTRLVDHFSSQGHPASSWMQLHTDGSAERQASRRSRLAARLFGGSFGGRSCHQPELLKSALLQCAREGHLAVLLLPPRPNVPLVGKTEAEKFHRQLHSAFLEMRPLRLNAGLLAVFTGSGNPDDAALWTSAAREISPTVLTVRTPGETPGVPESCQAILAAACQCATLATLQRLF